MKTIEFRMILSVVLFTIFILALERYQLSNNTTEEFVKFKESKNRLLVNTITPILTLNISIGLESANAEYLREIIKQNSDLEYVRLVGIDGHVHFEFVQEKFQSKHYESYNEFHKEIKDELTHKKVATLILKFSNKEFESMRRENQKITLNITIISVVLLLAFIFFMKHLFKNLKELQDAVIEYDPKRNNFPLELSTKEDEVSLIKNAIIAMVKKITIYTEVLDHTNTLLEEKVLQRTLELEESNRELRLLASVDPLTSLYNRRYFTKSSQTIFELAKRNGSALSVIMMDIDNFKSINDTYGHQVGDDVIVFVAVTLKSMSRKSDLVSRFGGEEFIGMLPETDLSGAYNIAEKVRIAIEKKEMQTPLGEKFFVTVSIGVSLLHKESDTSVENIIQRADDALYEAKNKGKNITCTHA